MALTIFYTSPTCRIAYSGPLVVMCLTGATEVADLDRFDEAHELVVRTHKHIGSITVMNSGFLTAKPGVMERADAMAAKFRPHAVARVVVINGRGLSAVVGRTVLASFSMISQAGADLKAVADPAEGLSFANAEVAKVGAPLPQAGVDELLAFINAPAAQSATP